jgi:glycosyltransferase involved in cell wall biosynthesis
LLVSPGDDLELAQALRRLIEEPGLIARLSQGMARLRGSILSWPGIAQMSVDVYEAARRHWHIKFRKYLPPEAAARAPGAGA